jgi:hypothetical protein
MAYVVQQLMLMSAAQLDDIFTNCIAGEIPDGAAKGTGIVAPGTGLNAGLAGFTRLFVWQGKTFDLKKGVLKNRISVFGISAIVARVYQAPSWLDNKECVVLDYSETSLVARWIRDEIRQIAPGLYLGRVYLGKRALTVHFALQF